MNLPGFTTESLAAVEKMLYGEINWPEQFRTGNTRNLLPRENKTTLAQGLTDMDIDDRPGRQPGSEGKQKEQDSEALFPVALPRGNPQQGPRSRSDLNGLRMFQEDPLTGQCNQKEKKEARQQQRTPEEKAADQKRATEMQGKDVAPGVDRSAAAQKAAATRKKCGVTGGGSKVPNTNPSGAGSGAGVGVTFEEAPTACRPKPKPRSTEQRQSTQQAQQAAQQQGQTFDQQPQQQVRDMASQGGKAERKKPLPECPESKEVKP
jgi:hypothetical protein